MHIKSFSQWLGESEQAVERYRAQEQAELSQKIPNIENYKVGGKVDKGLITDKNDLTTYNKIYAKYDALITPLLEASEESGEQEGSTLNEPAADTPGGWITPTHEQLADLYWFKALGQVLGTISGSAFWRTGDRAYANGTRQLSIHRDDSYRLEIFVFYPKRGTLVDPDGGQTIKSGIPFATLEDWNSALFLVYLKVIARLLGLRTLTGLRTAILGKDSSTITQFFNSINQHLQSVGVDPRPESFLFAILSEISTPEEREVIRDLIQLGLI